MGDLISEQVLAEPSAASQNGHAARILVVDDNDSNRDMLSRRLSRDEYQVDVAVDGRQALSMVAETAYDLILLDIMMPELNGYQVLERLKSDETLRHIPVLMISAVDDMDSVVRCIELGAEDYLPKPFNPTLLRARVTSSLMRKQLFDAERRYTQSLTRELEIGREIQRGFLPSALPQTEGWDVAARFKPARQVAGDFYDVFEIPGERVGLVIADVCGKGVGAALFMALFRSLIRAYAERVGMSEVSASTDILLEGISSTNRYIRTMHRKAHMFASVFFGILDTASGVVQYVNAGHLPPVIIGSDAEPRFLATTGPAVGLMADAPFRVQRAQLLPGELLLGFTDGVTEARNAAGEFFDDDRLLALATTGADSAAALLDRIESEVCRFAGGISPSDDLTLLAVRRG